MAASKDTTEEKPPRNTKKLNVWLPPDQINWLKEKGGASAAVRALITEAISMENLARSVKKKKKT
jgi:hypothetical protein